MIELTKAQLGTLQAIKAITRDDGVRALKQNAATRVSIGDGRSRYLTELEAMGLICRKRIDNGRIAIRLTGKGREAILAHKKRPKPLIDSERALLMAIKEGRAPMSVVSVDDRVFGMDRTKVNIGNSLRRLRRAGLIARNSAYTSNNFVDHPGAYVLLPLAYARLGITLPPEMDMPCRQSGSPKPSAARSGTASSTTAGSP